MECSDWANGLCCPTRICQDHTFVSCRSMPALDCPGTYRLGTVHSWSGPPCPGMRLCCKESMASQLQQQCQLGMDCSRLSLLTQAMMSFLVDKPHSCLYLVHLWSCTFQDCTACSLPDLLHLGTGLHMMTQQHLVRSEHSTTGTGQGGRER